MENLFTINPSANAVEINDGIFVRLARVKAIINHLIAHQESCEADDNGIVKHVVNQVLFTLLDYVEQIDCLNSRLNRMMTEKVQRRDHH